MKTAAHEKATAIAKRLVTEGKAKTEAEALAKAWDTDKELWKQHMEQRALAKRSPRNRAGEVAPVAKRAGGAGGATKPLSVAKILTLWKRRPDLWALRKGNPEQYEATIANWRDNLIHDGGFE